MSRTAWHYTIGAHAERILAEGFIRPATEFVPEGEKPCVWFSIRQHWEPTATKGITGPDGIRRDATMQEMMTLGGGLWRFGKPAAELTPWRKLQPATGMSRDMARGLVRAARAKGADPAFWFGSLEPVAIESCTVERLIGDAWQPVDTSLRGAA